ncbi:hypothetical protein Nepgr_021906 [Nepenthes gracilis]|uniref:Uncharacterized protein n=1 Tax=Nepenthes gracilis TaxID=150966 RepID=A0AAD3SZI1_NEPGR|nr:hypothetical protein Nepgr_021906 [Nepenthes gracilis]
MLLKTSSAPVVQTLTFLEYPKRDHFNSNSSNSSRSGRRRRINSSNRLLILDHSVSILLSFNHNNLISSSLISYPNSVSPKFDKKPIYNSLKSFRRAFSDSSLGELLAFGSCNISHLGNHSGGFLNFQQKPRQSMLESSPSFKIYDTRTGVEGEEESERGSEAEGKGSLLVRTATIADRIEAVGSCDFSFAKSDMGLIEEGEEEEEGVIINGVENLGGEEVEPASPPMYLAAGLGVDDSGSIVANFLESEKVEEYYRRLVEEYPSQPLILVNYAKLLQSKGDLHGAEDYYFRATVADPGDGGILSQYARLVWELHHDHERASKYFERAAQAAPQDSHVLASYASFLWEVEDGDREEDYANKDNAQIKNQIEDNSRKERMIEIEEAQRSLSPSLNLVEGLGNGIPGSGGGNGICNSTTGGSSENINIDEYYRRMVEENPSNPLFLRNYAHFLHQSKGDLHGAEEYYSRAVLADPQDGDILLQYAKLVWELYHDRYKALCYFERAAQADPGDSIILGAYAYFLWTTGEDEDEEDNEEVEQLNTVEFTASNLAVAS